MTRSDRTAKTLTGPRGGRPWTVVAPWTLWAAASVAVAVAYLFLSGPSGVLPRPAFLADAFGTTDIGGPTSTTTAGVAALIFALLAVAGALGAHAVRRGSTFLLEALAAESHGRAITGPGERLVWANPALVEILGEDAGESIEAIAGRIAGAHGKAQIELLRDVAIAGTQNSAEIRVGDVSESKWLRISAGPMSGREGYIVWSIEDVTAQREMEQVIIEERAKLVDFLESAEIGFYAVDAEGRFQYANRTFGEWLGIPVDVLLHERRLADIVAGPGVDPSRPFSPVPLGGSENRFEATLRRANGDEFQAEVMQTITADDAADTVKARAVVRDLSAKREFEQILEASEHRFRKLFEDAPAGIAILDKNGTVSDSNAAFRRIAAAGRDVSGRPVVELVAPDDRERLEGRLAGAAAGTVSTDVLDVRLAESADGTASLSVTPLEDPDGGLYGLILHLFDTTQHRRLEAQFTQSQKMQAVGQLAGGIAHDFNNLLTVMIGFCDLILQRHRPGEQTFADIMQIKQNANRAANLVRQLLAFSRQQTMQPKVLNITDVLAELSNLLRRLIGVNIKLDVVHGRDLGLVKVDQVQFEQVIINLAVNARDAMKEAGGTLTIATSNVELAAPMRRTADTIPSGRYVLITISDTGVGIPKAHLERIFDPFFSTKKVGSGTGLGLSTVYGIVSQTGGFVQVDSEESKGTTFSIYLPLYEETEEERAAAAAAEATAEGALSKDLSGVGTVLLVEDEDPVRLFGARALRNKGYQVLEAKNGDSAMEVIREAKDSIDLVISDVVMPELDGPGLVREVRQRYPNMKVIFISGYAEDEFRESLERESDIYFLPKPFSLEQLAGKVKDVLTG